MKVVRSFPFHGPNRHSDRTVIEHLIAFSENDIHQLRNGAERIRGKLTGLLVRNGLLTDRETFPPVALADDPTEWFCGLFAQLVLLLQRRCGHDVDFFRVRARENRECLCLIEHEHADVGMAAVKLAGMIITLRLDDFEKVFMQLREFSVRRVLPEETRAILRAAARRDIPTVKLDRSPFQIFPYPVIPKSGRIRPNGLLMLGQGVHHRVVDGTWCLGRSATRAGFAENEEELTRFLEGLGMPRAEAGTGPGRVFKMLVGNGVILAVMAHGTPTGERAGPVEVHADTQARALEIYRALDVALLQLDIRAADIGRPLERVGEGFCALQVAPRLDELCAGTPGLLDRAADALVAWLFPPGKPARIPVVAITGTNGKTTTCRMVAAIMRASGLHTGLVCSDNVYVDHDVVMKYDHASRSGHLRALSSGTVEAAVLECNHRGMLNRGLAFDWCDVAVCLNVTRDHIGVHDLKSEDDIAAVKRSLLEAARRVVLNADNTHCLDMLPRLQGRKACLVSSTRDIHELASLPGHADCFCVLEREGGAERIVLYENGARIPVMAVTDVPATFGGTAAFNTANAQHAVATCHLAGLDRRAIRAGLGGFRTDWETTPGRMNVYRGERYTAILDYAHNAESISRLCKFVSGLRVPGRKILVMGVAGDRLDDEIRSAAAGAAGYFDHYICRHHTLRGRKPHEVSALLKQGLVGAGVPEAKITAIPGGEAAVEYALEMAREGDLLVITHAHAERQSTWNLITSAQGRSNALAINNLNADF